MTVLSRYLLRMNLLYLCLFMAAGAGVYLLSDVLDRLDNFIEVGAGAGQVATYFGAKLPLIVSQTLPAVFLLTVIAQLSLMRRSRELLALEAGGASPFVLIRFFVAVGVCLCVFQIGFSQFVGVAGQRASDAIWIEVVRKKLPASKLLKDVWFREKAFVARFEEADPATREGRGLTVWELDGESSALKAIVTAERFRADPEGWVAESGSRFDPAAFVYTPISRERLGVRQELEAFVAADPKVDPATLPIWRLGQVIESLEAAGSNVERLRTAWHQKVAYGFSLVVMALVGMALVSFEANVFVNVGAGLALTFLYYVVFTLAISAGQKGVAPPVQAAWFANVLFGGLALLRLCGITPGSLIRLWRRLTGN